MARMDELHKQKIDWSKVVELWAYDELGSLGRFVRWSGGWMAVVMRIDPRGR